MSVVGKIAQGRAATVRCDACGRISSDRDGYYFDKKLKVGGHISSQGRECEHEFCKQCEGKNNSACPKCGRFRNGEQKMKTPEAIKSHDPKYNANAWQEYTLQELGNWVHLLAKRAEMRAVAEKRAKDLEDAQNYLDMMQAHLNHLRG